MSRFRSIPTCGIIISAMVVMIIGCQRKSLDLRQTDIQGVYEVSLKSLPSDVFLIKKGHDVIGCNRREFRNS